METVLAPFTVRDIMTRPVAVSPDTTLEEVARTMLLRCVSAVGVVNSQGELCGIVTASDFLPKDCGLPFSIQRRPQLFGQWPAKKGVRELYRSARTTAVQEIMSTEVITLTEDDSLEHLLELMRRHHLHHLPVIRNRIPVGMVARRDVLLLMA